MRGPAVAVSCRPMTTGTMTVADALRQLCVREDTLTAAEKSKLDRDGFLLLRGVLTREQVDRVNARLDELLAEEGAEAGKEVHQEPGTDRLADLPNKGEMFHPMIAHPRVLAAVAHVLEGDVKLSTLNSRAAQPGKGQQALHADWGDPDPTGKFHVCNSLWMLDDFVPENGPTRIVPGSHRSGKHPKDALVDPAAPHPQEVLALGRAGDVLVFNSHAWHGGTLNRTDKPRRSITAYYCRRHVSQLTDQRKHLRPETRRRLSEAALVLMDAL
jgi:hypothetical protein